MPLYENRFHAENKITVSEETRRQAVFGTGLVLSQIAEQLKAGKNIVADSWYGVDWAGILEKILEMAPDAGTIKAGELFLPASEIQSYKQKFITDDPGFGYANLDGKLTDIMDETAIREAAQKLESGKGILVYGSGAAVKELADTADFVYYFDMTRQPLLWQMWDGKLIPFAQESPKADYNWKEYYYCDYYLLDHQKNQVLTCMDYYVEAIDAEDLKMVSKPAYEEIVKTMLKYPVKEVKIYQPGPWGAYRYRDLWDVPGLECNAWNELAGPELSILIDFGGDKPLNIPFMALMQYPEEFVGPYLSENLPGMFPLDVWLDDGYFPEKEPAERISMPIHTHPSTDYIKRHFNEPLGRYETYYIAEAYEGANTWLGYQEDADLEEWERKCRESNNLTPISDWKEYMTQFESNVGDLYLIPPGTAHGHGGNQMVLEMDTCPSISGTEYSFFEYDFARNSWDDETKTMTGKPVKMHLEHGFDMEKWRRGNWAKEHLLPKARVIKWTKEYYLDRFDSLPEMPFEIERMHFFRRAENDTEKKFAHILTLTVGKKVIICSKEDPSRTAELDLFQSCTIPAGFGPYEIINPDGGHSTVVSLRWKKG